MSKKSLTFKRFLQRGEIATAAFIIGIVVITIGIVMGSRLINETNKPQDIRSLAQDISSGIPNCKDITGPVTLFVGEQAVYQATFSGRDPDLRGDIFLDNASNIPSIPQAFTGYNGGNVDAALQWSWTPTAADVGLHGVYCRAINWGVAQCRPPGMLDPAPGNHYECAGPAVLGQPASVKHLPIYVAPDRSIIPNCTLTSLGNNPQYTVGQEIKFAGNFTSSKGELNGEIFLDAAVEDLGNPVQNGRYKSLYFERVLPITTTQKTLNASWTPTAADVGTHTVHCRAWYDGIAECRPASLVDQNPRFPCTGPLVSQTFTVVNPAQTTITIDTIITDGQGGGGAPVTASGFKACATDPGKTKTQCADVVNGTAVLSFPRPASGDITVTVTAPAGWTATPTLCNNGNFCGPATNGFSLKVNSAGAPTSGYRLNWQAISSTTTPTTGAPPACVDSDQGENPTQYGVATQHNPGSVNYTFPDLCSGTTRVNEGYCNEFGEGHTKILDCPAGMVCGNGFCAVPGAATPTPTTGTPPDCIDSDGGNDLTTFGKADQYYPGIPGVQYTFTDACEPDGKIREAYCNFGAEVEYQIQSCPVGTVCASGKCSAPGTITAPTVPPSPCSANGTCTTGFTCVNSLCIPKPTNTSAPVSTGTCALPAKPKWTSNIVRNNDELTISWENEEDGLISIVNVCINGGAPCYEILNEETPKVHSIQKQVPNIAGKDIIVNVAAHRGGTCNITSNPISTFISTDGDSISIELPTTPDTDSEEGLSPWIIAGGAMLIVIIVTITLVAM